MKIGDYEDRIMIETKLRITELYAKMLKQFNVESGSDLEKRFAIGFRNGLLLSLSDVRRWLSLPDKYPKLSELKERLNKGDD